MSSARPAGLTTHVREAFCMETRPDPCGIVIFGASGDLAARKLYPSLFRMRRAGILPAKLFAVGVGRTAMTDEAFRNRVSESIRARFPDASDAELASFLPNFSYHTGDYGSEASYRALGERLAVLEERHGTRGNRLFYFSIPPDLYASAADGLARSGLSSEKANGAGWSRLIIEKPFGRDRLSASALNEVIRARFHEHQVYRIDHYLGKETVQSILVLRFANIIFEPVWNQTYVDHVQITAAETLGVGHRAGYYETAGALRDMFQNHLLQLLCVTAMEPPASFAAERVRDEKVKVLRAIRPIRPGDVNDCAVRGQYGPGESGGAAVPGYRQEKAVAPDSRTETFAAMRFFVDNWRWRGVPFYLRSGKRMARAVTEIAIRFKHVPHLLFSPLRPQDLAPNELVLRIQPEEGLSLTFETKHPGPKLCMSDVTMDFNYERSFGSPPEAYERLFLDAMAGDQTLFNRSDWLDEAWGLLEPVLDAWNAPAPDFPNYAAGSWGPEAADRLLAPGHGWRTPEL